MSTTGLILACGFASVIAAVLLYLIEDLRQQLTLVSKPDEPESLSLSFAQRRDRIVSDLRVIEDRLDKDDVFEAGYATAALHLVENIDLPDEDEDVE